MYGNNGGRYFLKWILDHQTEVKAVVVAMSGSYFGMCGPGKNKNACRLVRMSVFKKRSIDEGSNLNGKLSKSTSIY